MLDVESAISPAPTRRRRSTAGELEAALVNLTLASYAELQSEWWRLFQSPPPRKIGRNCLELGVA